MTGYAAIVAWDSMIPIEEALHRMLPALRARGPDGDSVVVRQTFGACAAALDVGDARLTGGHTLLGSLALAGHVRIDGRDDALRALGADGLRVGADDDDLLLFAHAWQRWGADAPAHLLGDYSAAVHDRGTSVVTLVRDIFGVRPLFYHASAKGVVVSNTLEAVRAHDGVSSTLDEDALASFIAAGFIEDPEASAYRDIRCVPPAHTLALYPDGRRVLRRYWDLPATPPNRSRTPDEVVAGFHEVLSQSVRDRLRTPRVTVFMSGGLDSTTLAALAARELGDAGLVSARTVDVSGLVPLAEVDRARIAAPALGVRHVISDTSDAAFSAGTPNAVSTPEPLDDPGFAAQHAVLAEASREGPVMFWGEGADALLMPPDLRELLRGATTASVIRDIVRYVWTFKRRPHLAVRLLQKDRGARSTSAHDVPSPPWLRKSLATRRDELRRRRHGQDPVRGRAAGELVAWHWRPLFDLFDAGVHGLPIDVRFPYLDRRVIAYALSVPPIPWTQRKQLLRAVASVLLPPEVWRAPKVGAEGLYEARLAQWWSRRPEPFVPCDALARLLHVRGLPDAQPATRASDMVVHLRLRMLDEWLRRHASSPQ